MRTLEPLKSSIIFLLILIPSSTPAVFSPEAISISAWVTADRSCVGSCMNLVVEDDLNCPTNSCLCRPDVMTSGIASLADCIAKEECGAPDFSQGSTAYIAYCSAYSAEVGGGSSPASVSATTTMGTSTGTGGVTLEPFSPPTSTTTASQTLSNSCTVGSHSCGAVGGISVAFLAAVVSVVAAVLRVFKRNRGNILIHGPVHTGNRFNMINGINSGNRY